MAREDKRTYADRARQITNKYKRRLGDDLSGSDKLALDAMNKELSVLQEEQELDRAILHKDMNKGMSMEGFAFGGQLPTFAGGGDYEEWKRLLATPKDLADYHKFKNFDEYQRNTSGYLFGIPRTGKEKTVAAPTTTKTVSGATGAKKTSVNMTPHPEVLGLTSLTPKSYPIQNNLPKNLIEDNDVQISIPSNSKPYSSAVSPLGLLPVLAGYGMNAAAIKRMGKQRYTPQSISPERISLASARTASEARRRGTANLLRGAAYANSPSQRYSQAMSGITEADRAYGEDINNSFLTEATQNAGYNQQARLFNAQQAARANELNMGLKNSLMQTKLQNNQGLVDGFAGYMKDVNTAKQYDAFLNTQSDNYERVIDPSYSNMPWYQRTANYLMGNKPYQIRARKFESIS